MSVMYLRGGTPLEGELAVHGAKNSVLPILAACLLTRGPVALHNCPRLTDVTAALGILRHLGCRVEQDGHTITVDPTGAAGSTVSEEQMRAMRSSIIFLGPLLARTGEAHLTYPGGCELGPRPIDLHLSAIRAMGCEVVEDRGIHCQGRPRGGRGPAGPAQRRGHGKRHAVRRGSGRTHHHRQRRPGAGDRRSPGFSQQPWGACQRGGQLHHHGRGRQGAVRRGVHRHG